MIFALVVFLAGGDPKPTAVNTPTPATAVTAPAAKLPRATALIDGEPATPKAAPFLDGEELTFEGTYGGLPSATATLTVETNGSFAGQPAVELQMVVKSGGFAPISVSSSGKSFIHPRGLYSLSYISDVKIRSDSDYENWVFDYDAGVAKRDRKRKKGGGAAKKSKKDYALTATHVQDAASMMFFFRAFDLKVGEKLSSKVFVSRKTWDLEVTVLAKETVKTPAGKFECLKLQPRALLNGVPDERSESTVWVTADERKAVVKFIISTSYGKGTFELKKAVPAL